VDLQLTPLRHSVFCSSARQPAHTPLSRQFPRLATLRHVFGYRPSTKYVTGWRVSLPHKARFAKHLPSVSTRVILPGWENGRGILIRTLLAIFADMPLPKTLTPSSRPILYNATMGFGYKNRSAGGFAPSAHIRTKTTSAGLPIIPAKPPARPAQAMVDVVDGLLPPAWNWRDK